MSSRPVRTDETPAPAARQPAPPRTEQLIETHKAWITAAAGLESRHSRRRPRYVRPLAISTGIVVATLLLVSVTRGTGGDDTGRTADLAGELIPTLGADAAAKPVARVFRGRSGAEEGRNRGGTRAAARQRKETARTEAAPEKQAPAEALREERVPEPSLALTSAPTAAPQVTDGRPAAEPDAAGTHTGDAQAPRTAVAVP